jgi:hypothetical protein
MVSRARRVDDRIRELCVEAVEAQNSHQAKLILAELQEAIHQYTQRLRTRAAAFLSGCAELPPDRRKTASDHRDRAP